MQKKLCVRLPPSAKMAGVGLLQSFVKLRFVAPSQMEDGDPRNLCMHYTTGCLILSSGRAGMELRCNQ